MLFDIVFQTNAAEKLSFVNRKVNFTFRLYEKGKMNGIYKSRTKSPLEKIDKIKT